MLRELNERCSDGLVVRLLWNDVDGDVVLAVQDGPYIFADVSIPPAEALEAFDHPFLYLGGADGADAGGRQPADWAQQEESEEALT